MKVDLHLHTTASDGCLSPPELVRLAARLGLSIIAITDHDSVEGVPAALVAAQAWPHLLVIPGVEISTDIPRGEVHILGYFIDYHHQGLKRDLERQRLSRQERARKIVTKLGNLGLYIDYQRVLELAGGGSVGRPHIAQAMLERAYISSLREAFDKYIGRDGPAYVEREKMTPSAAVELVVKVGGLPVLAHPAEIDGLEALLPQLKGVGLVGMEAYYNGYSPEITDWLVRVADKHGLIPTGGSDFHGLEGGIGSALGSVDVPLDSVKRLTALAEQRWLALR